MIRGIDTISLYTENAKKLAKFYRETIGLKQTFEGVMGDKEEIYAFEFKDGSDFIVLDHSKIHGKNKNPERYMINFEVDNLEAEVKKLKAAKVTVIQDIYHIEDYGYIATFADPDGNYFQLVKVRS